ncbi:enoyl-CoA hydratase [Streptomyces sp. TRM70350]|uniref:enoyl-CoA hydratase n=1 Tax=Streptomyces sp. TRM70350 TaxID=2856165 RepID=UPI001C455224|nr:enoyl-CoA hydratase [Streptomyces sp. TRM70350]MBV7696252.1 enoyl-CoA hydratase [Streptomyces sp. TRM70350]
MTGGPYLLVDDADGVLRVVFNRPQRLNALTAAVLRAAADTVEEAAADARVRVITLTGTGRAFCTGADLTDAGGDIAPVDGSQAGEPGARRYGAHGTAESGIDAANRLIRAITDVPKPVVAVVNGPAAGVGCSIATACDLIWAAESAYFLLAFANVGLMPDGGATATIPAAIGRARAARMALLAERVPAQRAFHWGLISAVVPDDQLAAEADKVVAALATGPTAAYAETKRALRASALAGLDHALSQERAGQLRLFRGADFAEGVRAFQEHRTPRFTGA